MTGRATAVRPRVLFRVAAGPRQGYGHLVRCVRLAQAMDLACHVSLRGPASAGDVVRRVGAIPAGTSTRTLRGGGWDVLVVDDPVARQARPWLRAARRLGVRSVSLHDLGLGAPDADLVIDGSIGAPYWRRVRGTLLAGPRFAILGARRAGGRARRWRGSVLVGLGGGPRLGAARRLGEAIRRRADGCRVLVAPGLNALSPFDAARFARAGLEVVAADAFAACLASVEVAVLAGGVSLYESAAAGTPAVAVAVVAAQRPTVRGFAAAGAAVDAGRLGPPGRAAADRVSAAVAALLADAPRRARMARAGRALVDGRGAARVARAMLGAA